MPNLWVLLSVRSAQLQVLLLAVRWVTKPVSKPMKTAVTQTRNNEINSNSNSTYKRVTLGAGVTLYLKLSVQILRTFA
ncbi:hypothetical protein [Paenibacillus sp. FSL M7-1046]|uniref:hypothetical protein n=1 Tax=Paenibacillus sp. FSL M7-1046 TaxID=2975315 RepID=UPI0030FC7893